MTSKLKCPFCGKELTEYPVWGFGCGNTNCFYSAGVVGSEQLWQALIRRTNQLNIAITDIHHAYKSLIGGCAEWRLYLEQTLKQIQDLDNDK